jgi:hypothetical protein
MKKYILGTFESRSDAERAISRIHTECDVDTDEISYLYRNTAGEVQEIEAEEVSGRTTGETAGRGAAVGATVGALAGLAVVAGVIPVLGPIIAAGPIAAALGLTGAIGTTAAGAVTGAAAGGLIGALGNLGVKRPEAKLYADRIYAGDVLVTVHSQHDADVANLMQEEGAAEVNVYEPNV